MATGVATKQLVTASSSRTFKTCRKLYDYRYEQGIRLSEDSFALRYGSSFHECVEILERPEGTLVAAVEHAHTVAWADAFTRAMLAAQIRAYAEHWQNQPFIKHTHLTERPFRIKLLNPETYSASRIFDVAGKIDAIVTLWNDVLALRETKTISENPGNNSRYWNRMLMDPQITLYYLAANELGFDIQTVVYDVVRKPCIAPKLATPVEDRKHKTDGTLYANQREADETPEEWEERLYADMMERPDFYLNRKEIPVLEKNADDFRAELWDVAKDLRQAQLSNRWYRNVTRNCDNCPYFELCAGLKVIEPGMVPEGFIVVNDVHPELQSKGGF